MKLSRFAPVLSTGMTFLTRGAVATPSFHAGLSPGGGVLQLVLRTIDSVQQTIRLMGYSFTSQGVVKSHISAKQRGVDAQLVMDDRSNRGKSSIAAMNLLVNTGGPVRTVDQFKKPHSKVLITDEKKLGWGFTSAAKANSENALVIRDDEKVAVSYLQHWKPQWAMVTDWYPSY